MATEGAGRELGADDRLRPRWRLVPNAIKTAPRAGGCDQWRPRGRVESAVPRPRLLAAEVLEALGDAGGDETGGGGDDLVLAARDGEGLALVEVLQGLGDQEVGVEPEVAGAAADVHALVELGLGE